MATANLGRVGFVNKGTYSGVTSYKANDVVTYNTGTYACIQANTGQAPTNTSYWQNWIADNVVHKTGDETIAGVKTFSSSPLLPVPTIVNQAISMGNIVEKTGAVIGYGTGSGGTVTQLTSKSTPVTLNKPTGYITMNGDALAAGAVVAFVFNNSIISYVDQILVTRATTGTTAGYNIWIDSVGNGACTIVVKNISAASLSEAIVLSFVVIKGA